MIDWRRTFARLMMVRSTLLVRAWILSNLLVAPRAAIAAGPEAAFANTRHVYERGETCELHARAPGADAVGFDISGWLPAQVKVKADKATYAINTTLLRAGDYTVRAKLLKAGEVIGTCLFPLTVARQHDNERIPVWRWGGGGNNMAWWTQRGFTGGFIASRRDPVEKADPNYVRKIERCYDEATRLDFELGMYVHPLISTVLSKDDALLCVLPSGTPCKEPRRKVYPLEPGVIAYAKAVTDSWMKRLSPFPSMRHVMFSSEWQTPMCINDVVLKMAKKEQGLDARQFMNDKGHPKPFNPKNVKDGIIEDDNPRYRFLQWWWQRGNGVAPLHEMLNKIAKAYRPDAITWHEPYRLAPVRYSHKGLDCIGTWTYGHPDIKRLCYTTYLQAAARPEGQLVHQDITLFVYGRMAVALDKSTADLSTDFAGKDPYFTAGPDYSREALWIVLSQRPDILCFYSAGRLSPDNPTLDPYISSPQTFDAIGQTCDALVKPYGPTIRASRRVAPRVAVLMSAAASWFRATKWLSGYDTEKTLAYATLLMMNHVPFDVLMDNDVVEGALDRYDFLAMPKADTLTRSMYARILAFAKKGGTVIATESLRAKIPNVRITPFTFTHQNSVNGTALAKGKAVTAEEDRRIMEEYARALAPLVKDVPRPADSASLRVLTNSLQAGDATYHFFVNDDRTYGPRFGKWKLRFETCRRQTAPASVAVDETSVLYDVLRRRPIEFERKGRRAAFELDLPGAWGALVAVLPERIGGLKIDAPEKAEPGKAVSVTIRVLGESGKAFDSAHPLQIDVLDPLMRKTEWCRYSTTRNGVCRASFIPAINDAPGPWLVRVRDLIGNVVADATVQCGSNLASDAGVTAPQEDNL